jgi:hypothetical protein
MQIELKALLTGVSEMKSEFSKSIKDLESLYSAHLKKMLSEEEDVLRQILNKKKNNIDEIHRYELQKMKDLNRERQNIVNQESMDNRTRRQTRSGYSWDVPVDRLDTNSAVHQTRPPLPFENRNLFETRPHWQGDGFQTPVNDANIQAMQARSQAEMQDMMRSANIRYMQSLKEKYVGIGAGIRQGIATTASFASSAISKVGMGLAGALGYGLHNAFGTEMDSGANLIAAYNSFGKGQGSTLTLQELIQKNREISRETGASPGDVSALLKSMATSGAMNPSDIGYTKDIVGLSQVFGTSMGTLGESFGTLRIQNPNMSGDKIMQIMISQQMTAAKSKLSPEDIARQANRIAMTLAAQHPDMSPEQANIQATNLLAIGSKTGIPAARERAALNQIIANMPNAANILSGKKSIKNNPFARSDISGLDIFDQMENIIKATSTAEGVIDKDKLKLLGFGSATQVEMFNALNVDYRKNPGMFKEARSEAGLQADVQAYQGKLAETQNTDFYQIKQSINEISSVISEAFAPALKELATIFKSSDMKKALTDLATSLAKSIPIIVKDIQWLVGVLDKLGMKSPEAIAKAVENFALGNPTGSAINLGAQIAAPLASSALVGLAMKYPALATGLAAGGTWAAGGAAALGIGFFGTNQIIKGVDNAFGGTYRGAFGAGAWGGVGGYALQGKEYDEWASKNLAQAAAPQAPQVKYLGPESKITESKKKSIEQQALNQLSTKSMYVNTMIVRGKGL